MSQANELEPEEEEIVSNVEEQETEKLANEKEDEPAEAEEEVLEDAEDEGEESPVEAKAATRGENRHQALANEKKQLTAERDDLIRREAAATAEINLMRQARYQTDTGEATRREQEARALMEPAERYAYDTNKEMNALKNQVYHMQINSQDMQDRAVFQAKASIDPDIAKHADEVEKIHSAMRARGTSSTRDDILKWRLGDELMKNKLSNQKTKKENGEKRIRQVSSNPSSARSDTGSSRCGKSFEQSFEEKYGDYKI